MFDKEKFGVKLRHLRKLKNCTQEQIASDIGCLRSTLSNIERGEKSPSLDMVIALANYLNVSIDYLLGTSDFPQPIPAHIQEIINQTTNSAELLEALDRICSKDAEPSRNRIDALIKGLDEESMRELRKYITFLHARQTLDNSEDESSVGSDFGIEKESIK